VPDPPPDVPVEEVPPPDAPAPDTPPLEEAGAEDDADPALPATPPDDADVPADEAVVAVVGVVEAVEVVDGGEEAAAWVGTLSDGMPEVDALVDPPPPHAARPAQAQVRARARRWAEMAPGFLKKPEVPSACRSAGSR